MHDPTTMPARLAEFLARVCGDAVVETYEPLVGGYSRVMASATVRWADGSMERLVLRGDPPPGTGLMETDRDTEWSVLSSLSSCGRVGLPRARWYDASGEHLGTKCIVMDHVDGSSLQAVLNAAGADEHPRYADDLVDTMAAIHAIEPGDLAHPFDVPTDWDDYLGGLIDRFRQADAGHVEPVPFLRYVAAWLDAHRPPPLPLRLVHSDFQPANIMVDRSGTHLVIDWELAHIGDPREDLGYYNVYSAASGPSLFTPDPERFLARYRERTGFGEDAVNMETMAYFSSLAAVTVYAQVLAGAAAMARGRNGGLMTTYTLNALTVGHNNFMRGCREWATVG
jgi:aminoglycoside phosphotransferase (APT) family kinase protein